MKDSRNARLNRVVCPRCGRELMSPSLEPDQLLIRHGPDCTGGAESAADHAPPSPAVAVVRVRSENLAIQDLARKLSEGLRSTDRVVTDGDSVVTLIEGDSDAARAALDRVLSVRLSRDLEVKLLPAGDASYGPLAASLPGSGAPEPGVPERRRSYAGGDGH